MSATEIINELPNLTVAERTAVLKRLSELAQQVGDPHLDEPVGAYRTVDLSARGITEQQASDLRARLKTFAEDWQRPEAAIYDEDPAR